MKSILTGECSQAIAGGVNTLLSPEGNISLNKAGALSIDGHCKTFSDKANGYVRSEGVGMFFLKRLSDAEKGGDHIYGLIIATAENHGGRANSLTSPNPKAQAALMENVYEKAMIDPRTVTYIEAHGTGTALGDPIEINGLKEAFGYLYEKFPQSTLKEGTTSHCGLGSMKSNIGHLEMAAGIAGAIKVVLQFKHKQLVKSLNSEPLNPYIDLKSHHLYRSIRRRVESIRDREENNNSATAGVVVWIWWLNAHIVLEEYVPHKQMKNVDGSSCCPA